MATATLDPDTLADYTDRIRNAYRHALRDLDKQPGDWLSLTDLRPYIGGHRPHVDEALRQLARTREAAIVPESNQKALTGADREAAVVIGDQHKHAIAIR